CSRYPTRGHSLGEEALIWLFASIPIVVVYLMIPPPRYRWQFILLNLWVGAWTVNILDSMIVGGDYYFFWFGFWRERLNLPKALFLSIALSIYPLALAGFFLISRARRHDTTSSGQLLDPFYTARHALRTLVVCYPVINFLTTIHDFIVEGVVVGVISGILLAFSVAVSVFLWRLIPNRPI